MQKNKYAVFFYIFFCWVWIHAQETTTVQTLYPLSEILTKLETQFEVKFSYDASTVKKHVVEEYSENDLKEVLNNLSRETNLNFEIIADRYILITQKPIEKNLSICGQLLDKENGMPIENATVWVPQKSFGVMSDEQGYFTISKLQSDWFLKVHFLGYHTVEVPVYKMQKNGCTKIYISQTNEELEEVLLSDYLTKGMTKKRDGAIRISPQNLGILPGLTEPDVLQSLQLLPGVQTPGESASELYVRGGTPDQNLILYDGIKMYESGHFFGMISSFNPYVTKNIAFYKSGTSAKYGERIGGVLDISSGEEIPAFNAGFGLNLLHADAYIKAPIANDKIGLIVSGRRSLTDVWNTITYQRFSESVFQNTRIVENEGLVANDLSKVENNFYFHDYNVKLIADLSDDEKLVLSNLYNKNKLNFYSENERFREKNTDELEVANFGASVKWEKKWSDKWSTKIAGNHSEYTLDYGGVREIDRRRNSRTDVFVKYNNVKELGAQMAFINQVGTHSSWQYGYQLTANNVTYVYDTNGGDNNLNQSLGEENQQNNAHGFYAEYALKNKNHWNLAIGARLNYFSLVNKSYFEPRFYVSKDVSEHIQLKFSTEIKNQVLSQIVEFRNNGLGIENEIWALSNGEDLAVLNNVQVSGGFLVQKDGWNFDVDIYTKKINGLTLLTEDVATRVQRYMTGTSTINGVDVLLKKRFGNYRSWISYTYAKTQFLYDRLNEGNAFDGTYDIPHSFLWSHTYNINRLAFSLGWKVRSGTPYTKGLEIVQGPNGNYRILYEDSVNTQRLPLYKKVDFSTTYKFYFNADKTVRGKFGVSLMNIFNTKNIIDRNYEIKTERVPGNQEDVRRLVEIDQISIGFTPNLVFRVDF